ncbi:MAG: hypothetical protein M1820_005750 [Bogoriella megaspora]|nr:MAG: hypothetical protein M1820_005750 [Bogoriella megaspora]
MAMRRPRNRQPPRGHHNQNPTSNPHGSQQGRGRGRGNNNSHRARGNHHPSSSSSSRPQYPSSVPPARQIQPGVRVSIVLKADQGTGREVQGTVGEVLTRGNHPRGVKVRLVDGRVGRVQRIVEDGYDDEGGGREGVWAHAESIGGEGREGWLSEASGRPDIMWGNMGMEREVGNFREEGNGDGDMLERRSDGRVEMLDTFDKAADTKLSVCPVCGAFEGDEMAVAHHVGTHFEG